MREIGGYLELEGLINKEYYPEAIALNTARNALVYLAKVKKLSKVYIPYYLCDSVYKVCERESISYEFYHVDECFMPVFDKALGSGEYLYVVNYFGQLSISNVKSLKDKYSNIILDNVQAFFEKPVKGVDTIYSCRKFFGVPDGAYLVTDAEKIELPLDKSKDRVAHLLGRFEGESASDYYADFVKNDEAFESIPLKAMSKLTHNILGAIDYASVKKARTLNWEYLHSKLGKINKLELNRISLYAYPFYVKDGEKARKLLAEKKIFVPTLWKNVVESDADMLEKDYAINILPLPVDQRYGKEDMERIISEVLKI